MLAYVHVFLFLWSNLLCERITFIILNLNEKTVINWNAKILETQKNTLLWLSAKGSIYYTNMALPYLHYSDKQCQDQIAHKEYLHMKCLSFRNKYCPERTL